MGALLQDKWIAGVGFSATNVAAVLVWERLLIDGRQKQPFYKEFAMPAASNAPSIRMPEASKHSATASTRFSVQSQGLYPQPKKISSAIAANVQKNPIA